MKILQINSVYKRGSTGIIMYHIHQALVESGEQSVPVYGRGCKVKENSPVYRINLKPFVWLHALLARITGRNGCFGSIAALRAIAIIKKEKPDIVHLHNLHGYYIHLYLLLNYLKKKRIKTLLTLHDEFMYTGKCAYTLGCTGYLTGCAKCEFLERYPKAYVDQAYWQWKKKRKLYHNFSSLSLATNSEWLAKRLSGTIMNALDVTAIHNGIDTERIFYPRNPFLLKEKLKLGGRKVVLSVSDDFSDKRKGLEYVLRLSELNPKLWFIIVGTKEKINLSNVRAFPLIKNQNILSKLYSMADTLLITSISDTFPTVCIESLACGTPITGFDTGGAAETAPDGLGMFVPFGDMDELEKALLHMIKQKQIISFECRKYAIEHYSRKVMTDSYLALYHRILSSEAGESQWNISD